MAPANSKHLPRRLDQAAKSVAKVLGEHGHRAWIVGGAVRDLLLGRKVSDLDMTSGARPEEVEALFERTIGVGRVFGTMIVVLDDVSIEVTTFRADGDYSDGRRPDAVCYSETPEQDASRRDFTCNAMYLDPLTDEFLDPTGGEDDLEAGILRTVGEPLERFQEDSLRLLRMARFAARLELDIPDGDKEAAKESVCGLGSVSPERILGELSKVLTNRNCHVAIGLMEELKMLEHCVPDIRSLHGAEYTDTQSVARRIAALEWLESDHLASGLAVLFDPLGGTIDRAKELLQSLRPSKSLVTEVANLWSVLSQVEAIVPSDELDKGPHRAARLRIIGDAAWPRVRDLCAAYGDSRCHGEAFEGGHLGRNGRELALFETELTPEQIVPEPLLTSSDLANENVPKGKRWGELLSASYHAQLEGTLTSREQALDWLKVAI